MPNTDWNTEEAKRIWQEEAAEKKARELIIAMINKNLSIQTIADITNFSFDKLRQIANENKLKIFNDWNLEDAKRIWQEEAYKEGLEEVLKNSLTNYYKKAEKEGDLLSAITNLKPLTDLKDITIEKKKLDTEWNLENAKTVWYFEVMKEVAEELIEKATISLLKDHIHLDIISNVTGFSSSDLKYMAYEKGIEMFKTQTILNFHKMPKRWQQEIKKFIVINPTLNVTAVYRRNRHYALDINGEIIDKEKYFTKCQLLKIRKRPLAKSPRYIFHKQHNEEFYNINDYIDISEKECSEFQKLLSKTKN